MAAYLGRLEITVQDSSGNGVGGVSADVRKQGATVNGTQTNNVITVFSPGSIVVGDQLSLNGGILSASVTSLTATTLTLNTTIVATDGDRLNPVTAPTVYTGNGGASAKTNPLTTASSVQVGMAFCYVQGGEYDVILSGGSPAITTTVLKDVHVGGQVNLSTAHTTPYHKLDTYRTAASSDHILSVCNAGVEKFYVKHDGKLGATTFEGAVTVSTGGLTVSTTGVTITTGGLSIVAGGADIEGDVTFRDNILCGPLGFVDCNLYRNAADQWKTDDSLLIAKNLTVTGYTLFTVPSEITVASATLTLPSAGTAFVVTAALPQTVTAISGATAGQFLVFSAKSGTSNITFSGANFFLASANAVLSDTTTAANTGALTFYYDGTVFRLVGNLVT